MAAWSEPALAEDGVIDVAVVLFDGVLTSDVIAPLEVFGAAAAKPWPQRISVTAISASDALEVTTNEGLRLSADVRLRDAGDYDAVIVPSRYGMGAVLGNAALIDFIRRQPPSAWMASNCSGALVLAEAGVLDGRRATTWAGGEAAFQRMYPAVLVQHDVNVVIDGRALTSNGSIVSYEAAIALLAELTSDVLAAEVAHDLQFGRVANATLPPRLDWRLAFIIACAALILGMATIAIGMRLLGHRRANSGAGKGRESASGR
jgi:transcriptional regulator GlxA family with amidase domain